MSRNTRFVTLSICGAALIGFVWLANAGDLNPPVGPVAPTMRTLDEVYDVAAGGGAAECPECVWQSVAFEHNYTDNNWVEVVPGSGVLHAVAHMLGYVAYFHDGPMPAGAGAPAFDEPMLMVIRGYNSSADVNGGYLAMSLKPIDVRFENGLYMFVAGGSNNMAATTVLYRSDP